MAKMGEHAVVLGASMGGLLAARVLSDFYRTVTVVERDVLPMASDQRRGVPQGRHVHTLWPRGSQILDDLFPGFPAELISGGCPKVDGDFSQVCASFGGHQLVRSGTASNFQPRDAMYFPSRPFLEDRVRRRVRGIWNVELRDGYDVVDLMSSDDRSRVTGVTITARDGDEKRSINADLVVDATGRGSRTPAFLDHLGYDRPVEDEVVVRLAYASQLLRIPDGMHKETMVVVGPVAGRPTGMVLSANENNTWMFTAFGMVGHEPPADRDGVLTFVEEFTPAPVVSALRYAEPLGDVARYRTPSSRWRRYDKMERFPAGLLLVVGDAICSFNPIYGQGMTVAALEAMVLDRCLRRGSHSLAPRFFRAAAKTVSVAWQLAVGGDLALPEVEGPRPLAVRLTNRYVDRVQAAAETDTLIADRFVKVAGFSYSPASLLNPFVVLRVAAINWRQSRACRSNRTPSLIGHVTADDFQGLHTRQRARTLGR
jgi:2-polyprenyl-6-methoxyphenol hydroxylase-like FAD-dependent oxidoreductase